MHTGLDRHHAAEADTLCFPDMVHSAGAYEREDFIRAYFFAIMGVSSEQSLDSLGKLSLIIGL